MPRSVNSQQSPEFISYKTFTEAMRKSGRGPPSHSEKIKDFTLIKTKRPARPTYSKMIDEAVSEKYQRRKGASLKAIKKYLEEKYSLDVKNSTIRKRICKYLRESTGEGGHLRQLTGKGANGSFVLKNKKRSVKREPKQKESQDRAGTRHETLDLMEIKPVGRLKRLKSPPTVVRMKAK